MPRKILNPAKRKAMRIMEKIDQVESTLDPDRKIPSLQDIANLPMIKIAIKEILKGNGVRDIKEKLFEKGYELGMNKAYQILRLAKEEIIKASERDLAANFGWVQANLLNIHAKAVERDDDKMRLVTIRELITLYGLNRPHETVKDTEVTPEMVEQFEQKLLR